MAVKTCMGMEGGSGCYIVGSDNELYTGGIEPIVSIH